MGEIHLVEADEASLSAEDRERLADLVRKYNEMHDLCCMCAICVDMAYGVVAVNPEQVACKHWFSVVSCPLCRVEGWKMLEIEDILAASPEPK